MNRGQLWVMTVVFFILVLTTPALAQFDVVAPFLNQEVGDYRIKSRVIYPEDHLLGFDQQDFMVEVYQKGDLRITRTELLGRFFEFAMEQTQIVETNFELFYGNYEVRIVGTEEAAGRSGLVIELFHKQEQKMRQKYLVDQETGLVLNQYSYDRDGNLVQGFEALEVDFDPDFSRIDLDNIQYDISLEHQLLTKEAFEELLPWLILDDLPFPDGFATVAYSQVDSAWYRGNNPYLQENYPDRSANAYWVWVSDGFEAFVIEVWAATGEDIIVQGDSYLEVVELSPGAIIIALEGQPATVQVQGSSLALSQTSDILLAMTGAQGIKNLEALERDLLLSELADQILIDYTSLPLEPITEEEFLQLNPWIRLGASKQPAGFTVTGLYRVDYPETITDIFALHQEHPESEIMDFVVELSAGDRLHYISVSFGPDFHKERLLGTKISRHGLNTIEFIAIGPVFSIYFQGQSLFEDDLFKILQELFPRLEPFLRAPIWEPAEN